MSNSLGFGGHNATLLIKKYETDGRSMMEIEQLCQLIQAVSDSKLTEFTYEEDGVKITMASGKEL